MLKKFVFLVFVVILSSCSSLEKTHQFKVDRRSSESQKILCNPSDENYYEIMVVGENQFFIERATAPEWVGPLLIPFIPGSLSEKISEIQLTFKGKAPENIQDWKLHFESDGLTVGPKNSAHQVVFSFPARSPSDRFELLIPNQNKTIRIQFTTESSPWKYTPFFIIFGDRFPFFHCNQ